MRWAAAQPVPAGTGGFAPGPCVRSHAWAGAPMLPPVPMHACAHACGVSSTGFPELFAQAAGIGPHWSRWLVWGCLCCRMLWLVGGAGAAVVLWLCSVAGMCVRGKLQEQAALHTGSRPTVSSFSKACVLQEGAALHAVQWIQQLLPQGGARLAGISVQCTDTAADCCAPALLKPWGLSRGCKTTTSSSGAAAGLCLPAACVMILPACP